MAFKILCVALALVCAATAAPESRIVGGIHTTIEEFPYIVALNYRYPGAGITIQRCVGALVSSFHVLTTAFCYTGANIELFTIRAGSTNSMSGGSAVAIRQVIKHPDYQETPRLADIAVTELATPLGISSTINILFLPPQSTYIPDGQTVKIVSWGFESMAGPQLETLKKIYLRKVPLIQCQESYANENTVGINDNVICASEQGAVGTCRGDSGAPMVIDQVVVGISSYFHECATDKFPDVFTRIDRYTNWIVSVAVPPSNAVDNFIPVQVKSALSIRDKNCRWCCSHHTGVPHTIALVYHFPSVSVIVQRCTGGLISSWHVLTSALCFSGADLNMFEVRGGSTFSLFGGTVTRISRVITHPSFRAEPLTADIAVVVLTSPMPLSSNINIMYLPPQNTNIPAGQPVRVASWGLMSLIGPPQQMLRKIYQSTVSLNQCTASYGTQNSVTIDDSVICATAEGAAGTCIGDSGAPMVIDRVVVGLAAHHQCGMGALPDVFTRVDRYTNWIMSVTRSSFTAADNAIPVRIKSVEY